MDEPEVNGYRIICPFAANMFVSKFDEPENYGYLVDYSLITVLRNMFIITLDGSADIRLSFEDSDSGSNPGGSS